MTTKYFSYGGNWWTVWESFDPWGTPMTYAIECDNNDCDHENSAWEYVDASTVTISDWFLRSDPEDLFIDEQYEKEHDDPNHPFNIKPFEPSKLKAMLEGLRNPSFDESRRTVGEAADILGLIRSRNSNTTSDDINKRVLSEKQLALLNQSDAEYELLNIDASYMALVRKLG